MNEREVLHITAAGDLSDSDRQYQMALDCIDRQAYNEALELLDPLVMNSANPRIRYARAVVYLSTGEYRKAGSDLLRTIARDRRFLPAFLHLGYVQLTLGRTELAVTTLEAALAIDPCFVDALCVLGEVWLDLGESVKAKEAFDKALTLEPSNPEPHRKIAMYCLSKGDMQGLRDAYEVLLELDADLASQIAELLP
jgi:tetratricopeptide (TPR) repeat protein